MTPLQTVLTIDGIRAYTDARRFSGALGVCGMDRKTFDFAYQARIVSELNGGYQVVIETADEECTEQNLAVFAAKVKAMLDIFDIAATVQTYSNVQGA